MHRASRSSLPWIWKNLAAAAHLLLTCACCAQPSLATLLAKPDKGMKDSIFASTNGQTRKLQSYFPDPTMDIDNKVRSQSRCTDALL